jgi:hypothetical protein
MRYKLGWNKTRLVPFLSHQVSLGKMASLKESFHDKFRDECLKREWFQSLLEAKIVIEACNYTIIIPSSLIVPWPFKPQWLLPKSSYLNLLRLSFQLGIKFEACHTTGASKYVILDGQKQNLYELIGLGGTGFSSDGKHRAYIGKLSDRRYPVLKGGNGAFYDLSILSLDDSTLTQPTASIPLSIVAGREHLSRRRKIRMRGSWIQGGLYSAAILKSASPNNR